MEQPTEQAAIPLLPGHSKKAWKSFLIPLGLMIIGLALFGFGVYRESSTIQIAGGLVGLVGFIGMIISLGRFQTGRCPTCSELMSQGWDSSEQRSDGIFTCKGCGNSWRTAARWGTD